MAQGNCRRREAAGREIIKSQKKSAADILSAALLCKKQLRFNGFSGAEEVYDEAYRQAQQGRKDPEKP